MNSEQLVPVELPGYPFQVYQTKTGQTVTQDTQFLLDTILDRFADTSLHVLELGSGTGILSILLKLHRPKWQITGIEIQPHLAALSRQNALNCNLQIQFVEGDIKQISDYLGTSNYDLVVSNPPFFRLGEFRLSENTEKAISRHELRCTMDDVLSAVVGTLKQSGRSFLIYPINRIDELKTKIKNIDLQFITEFSLSTKSHNNKDKTVILELAHADYR
jgi:tRNA1(Val) A37 N6-methylase TrmN6